MLRAGAALLGVLLVCGGGGAAAADAEQQPVDVLREHVGAALEVLGDDTFEDTAREPEQRERLCEIAHRMFDVHAFSRLVLMGGWREFTPTEQDEFVDVFSEFLCRYYLSRLQLYYTDETVDFGTQEFKSPTRATVDATVTWDGMEIPVEVRMGLREGRWRAYDIRVSGISAVLVYRAQFQPKLLKSSPHELIKVLRQRIEEQG